MDIVKYDVYRGPNIGVYISVNDTIGLVPMGFAETKAKKIRRIFEYRSYVYSSCKY